MTVSNVTETISRFIVESSFENLPEKVVEAGKCSFLDWISVTLGGAKEQPARILVDFIKELGGKKQASILGYGISTSTLNAAFVNGAMSHVLDYDDAHSETRNHTSAPLFPAVLAIAEKEGLNGKDLITAYIIGFEVSNRIGLALGKRYYEEGWHATSILGRFGAAAGSSNLLGLKTTQVKHALGLAGTQSGGIRSAFGTMAKPFHAGKAAADGLQSAMLAQRNFTGPKDIFKDSSEYVGLFSEEYDSGHIVKGLAKNYHILTNSFKLHAACLLLHPVIDGLLSIKREVNPSPDEIESIELEVAPLCLSVTDKPRISDGAEGKFSIHFCSALAMIEGNLGNREFSNALVKDRRIRDLMQKVRVSSILSLEENEAKIVVNILKGGRYSRQITAPKGHPRNPMTFDEILEKFRVLNRGVISGVRIEEIAEMVENLQDLLNIRRLIALCGFAS
jgi:2-methylcitrate dehydratase PrpD